MNLISGAHTLLNEAQEVEKLWQETEKSFKIAQSFFRAIRGKNTCESQRQELHHCLTNFLVLESQAILCQDMDRLLRDENSSPFLGNVEYHQEEEALSKMTEALQKEFEMVLKATEYFGEDMQLMEAGYDQCRAHRDTLERTMSLLEARTRFADEMGLQADLEADQLRLQDLQGQTATEAQQVQHIHEAVIGLEKEVKQIRMRSNHQEKEIEKIMNSIQIGQLFVRLYDLSFEGLDTLRVVLISDASQLDSAIDLSGFPETWTVDIIYKDGFCGIQVNPPGFVQVNEIATSLMDMKTSPLLNDDTEYSRKTCMKFMESRLFSVISAIASQIENVAVNLRLCQTLSAHASFLGQSSILEPLSSIDFTSLFEFDLEKGRTDEEVFYTEVVRATVRHKPEAYVRFTLIWLDSLTVAPDLLINGLTKATHLLPEFFEKLSRVQVSVFEISDPIKTALTDPSALLLAYPLLNLAGFFQSLSACPKL